MFEQDPRQITKRTRDALSLGVTRKQLRGPGFNRPSYGIVRPSGIRADDLALLLADVLARSTPFTCVGGWASLRLQGNEWFDGLGRDGRRRPVLVHCLPGAQPRRDRMIEPFRGLIHPDEMIDLGDCAVSTMARATFDEMRLAGGLRNAVVALDTAVSTTHGHPHTALEAVATVVRGHHKVRGIVQARRALALGSTRAASPWESRTRRPNGHGRAVRRDNSGRRSTARRGRSARMH